MKQLLISLAVLLWTVAGTLLVFAVNEENWRMSQLALSLQLTACIPTLYLVFDHVVSVHRRTLLKQLSQVVGRADAQRAEVRHLKEAGR